MENETNMLKTLLCRVYSSLSTLKTSVYVLGLMALLFMLGTVFPQGADFGDYEGAGGKLLWPVKYFSLLDFFNSPLFLASAFVMFLNLAVCSHNRFYRIIERRTPATLRPNFTLAVKSGFAEADEKIRLLLVEKLGFKPIKRDAAWSAFESGLYYRWLTWTYHTAMALCFVGLLLSGLYVREGFLTLSPGKVTSISEETVTKLGWLAKKNNAPDFNIVLDGFVTEYVESPELDYPKDKMSRLSIALGWKNLEYDLKDKESLFPKDWFSKLRIVRGSDTVFQKTIELNDPLKRDGYTFYQMGYEQSIELKISGNAKTVKATPGEKLEIAGVGVLQLGTLRVGTVQKQNKSVEKITPYVTIKKITKAPEGKEKKELIGRLELDKPMSINARAVTLTKFGESSVLSYRYDPGVPLLWALGTIVFVVMTLRCFGAWHRVVYTIEEKDGLAMINLRISAKGLLSSPERLFERIERLLAKCQ